MLLCINVSLSLMSIKTLFFAFWTQVNVPFDVLQGSIPDDLYKQACVSTTEEALASCQVVGYPAMIKASWGGGGKGIRKVHNDEEVKALFKQVQGEVPGSPIFIMKVATQVLYGRGLLLDHR